MPKATIRAHPHPRSRRSGNWLYFGVAGAVTLIIGLGAVLLTTGSPGPGGGTLPDWLNRAPSMVREAYAYAVEHPETMGYIPCYCGCGGHDGHRSAENCFVASRSGPDLAYDRHGAGCDMCVDIALMTKKNLAGGKSLREAREAVVKKYSGLGPPTNTPPIP